MMTKEEVTSIVTYCQMHKVSYSKRLKELGVPTWKFYEYKSRYASETPAGKAEFVQITDGGTYVPAARLESTRGARSGGGNASHKPPEYRDPSCQRHDAPGSGRD